MLTGTYHYAIRSLSGDYTHYHMRVEIIGETVKSYHVRYLTPHADGRHGAGYETWVKRTKIDYLRKDGVPVHDGYDGDLRLPYKD